MDFSCIPLRIYFQESKAQMERVDLEAMQIELDNVDNNLKKEVHV